MPTNYTSKLKALGIPHTEVPSKYLLSTDLKLRSPQEIATRLIVISYLIGVYYDVEGKELSEQLKKYNLFDALSKEEKEVLAKNEYEDQDFIDAGWLQESIEVLAWVLGMTKQLDHTSEAHLDIAENIPVMKNPEKFISKATLRASDEIFDELQLLHHIFQYLQNEEHLLLDADIILERHRAILWICGESW